jgi:hypothetical protein
MGLWAEAIDEWFRQRYISSAKIIAENKIVIIPGKVEDFGFHFSRDLIPFDGNIQCKLELDGNYIMSYPPESVLVDSSKEVFDAFRKNSQVVIPAKTGIPLGHK